MHGHNNLRLYFLSGNNGTESTTTVTTNGLLYQPSPIIVMSLEQSLEFLAGET